MQSGRGASTPSQVPDGEDQGWLRLPQTPPDRPLRQTSPVLARAWSSTVDPERLGWRAETLNGPSDRSARGRGLRSYGLLMMCTQLGVFRLSLSTSPAAHEF